MPAKETYEIEGRRFRNLKRTTSRAVELSCKRGKPVTVIVRKDARTYSILVQFQDEPQTENDGDIYRQQITRRTTN